MEVPRPQRAPSRPALRQITAAVCKICGVDEGLLLRQNRSDARLAIAAVGRSFHYSQREVGEVLGIGRAGFSMMERAAKARGESDRKFQTFLGRCMKDLACMLKMFKFVDT